MPRLLLLKTWTDIEGATCSPPLGLMYLASKARRDNPGYDVSLIDLNVERQPVHRQIARIEALKPDVIGISCMSYEARTGHRSAAFLKARLPRCKIVVGGPYPSASALTCVEDPNIDFAVFGEGEETFTDLLRHLDASSPDFSGVAGVAWRRDGRAVKNAPRPYIEDLDGLPFPAWDLLDMERYFNVNRFHYVHVEKRYMPIFTSRACPYQCTYCHDIFGKGFHARSPENVMAEIRELHDRYDIRELQVFDDIFNIRTDRASAICDRIIDSGLKLSISFPNGLRGDILTEELLGKMKRAGTYKICYAIETASPRLQKVIKKGVKLQRLKDVIAKTDRAGILCHGFFIFGLPTETREEVLRTVDYALSSRLHFGGFYFLDPFEGTEIANLALEMKPELMKSQDHSFFSSDRQLSEVPTRELEAIRLALYRRFYLDPWRVARILWLMPKKLQIFTLMRRFFELAFAALRPRLEPDEVPDPRPARERVEA